jgi:hypothetical protein
MKRHDERVPNTGSGEAKRTSAVIVVHEDQLAHRRRRLVDPCLPERDVAGVI